VNFKKNTFFLLKLFPRLQVRPTTAQSAGSKASSRDYEKIDSADSDDDLVDMPAMRPRTSISGNRPTSANTGAPQSIGTTTAGDDDDVDAQMAELQVQYCCLYILYIFFFSLS
jgi:hypothetical protein